MTKQVATVTGNQFGFIYLDGIPYNPAKVKRFLAKGAGIKVQDIVIFDAGDDRVLDYIKNAIYAEGKEAAMVKHYVRTSEIKKATMGTFEGVSDAIRKELAEEGIAITNDGIYLTPIPPESERKMVKKPQEAAENQPVDCEIDQSLLVQLSPEGKRTFSILLQSSLKVAAEVEQFNAGEKPVDPEQIKARALDFAFWIDRNSTKVFSYD